MTGTHTYAEEGIYHAEIDYENSDGAEPADAVRHQGRRRATDRETGRLHAVVGTSVQRSGRDLHRRQPRRDASDFSATIDWGDGTTLDRHRHGQQSGGFVVSGTHTYASTDSFKTNVQIIDVGGATTTAHGTATVQVPRRPCRA